MSLRGDESESLRRAEAGSSRSAAQYRDTRMSLVALKRGRECGRMGERDEKANREPSSAGATTESSGCKRRSTVAKSAGHSGSSSGPLWRE